MLELTFYNGCVNVKWEIFPKIYISLDGTDFVVATLVFDEQLRLISIKEIKDLIQKCFRVPLKWRTDLDASLRATELFGCSPLAVEGDKKDKFIIPNLEVKR